MPYVELTNRAEMVAAVNGEPGVYSLIYCHEGIIDELAEKTASEQSSDPVKAYSVDVTKNPKAKDFLSLYQFPSPVVFKNGKEVKRVESISRDNAQELGAFFKS
ncbi:MAG: hypothetical protein ASARMPREDX12_006143 [Alectoria sarmentosa]|nr:MAG: hypothetical protein ASARMPREDX12_006143 [Alectoria sarmentosa]CAD6592758.1 MAG: hypothetical protein ASARMPRED_006703 [Alectoria sarmentosa]